MYYVRQNLLKLIPLNQSLTHGRTLSINVDKFFGGKGYELHLLDEGPSATAELQKDQALTYYRQMYLIRQMEKKAADLYKERKIVGFCHLYSGQEACAVGIHSLLGPNDTITTTYRCHAYAALLTDFKLDQIFAELVGNQMGLSRGKGGSMHLYTDRLFGGNGIVGAHVPLGTGVAFAHKYKNNKGISVTLFGDGASNQGQVSESFNMAMLYKLPALYVVENNHYGMGTPRERSSANPNYYKMSTFIPGVRANGMELLTVREAVKFCFEHIRSGKGPIVLELLTYRYFGHSQSDPGTSYRTREEIQTVRQQKDAILAFRKLIIDSKLGTEDEVKAIEDDSKKKVDADLKKALADKPAPHEELYGDIYVDWKWKIRMPKPHTYAEHKKFSQFKHK